MIQQYIELKPALWHDWAHWFAMAGLEHQLNIKLQWPKTSTHLSSVVVVTVVVVTVLWDFTKGFKFCEIATLTIKNYFCLLYSRSWSSVCSTSGCCQLWTVWRSDYARLMTSLDTLWVDGWIATKHCNRGAREYCGCIKARIRCCRSCCCWCGSCTSPASWCLQKNLHCSLSFCSGYSKYITL